MPMVTGALMTFTVKKNHAVVPRNPLSEKREARPGIAVLGLFIIEGVVGV